MTQRIHILVIIIGLLLASCQSSEVNNANKVAPELQDTSEMKSISIDRFYTEDHSKFGSLRVFFAQGIVNIDTLYNELKRTGDNELYFQSDTGSILFLNKGYILSKDRVNAIILSSPTDTTYCVELFTYLNEEWKKDDEIIVESHPLQFDLDFVDFNFDGIKDIYIQCSMSNGYAISRGHLLTVDKTTYKFKLHQELRELGNLTVDPNNRMVISEETISCKSMRDVCRLSHKWINGNLKQIKRDCPCEE